MVDGGDAFANSIVYAPCSGGIVAVKVGASPPSLSRLWQTSSGSTGPPIIAGGTIWTIGGTTLFGLDPATGSPVHQFPLGTEANHFPTPSVGDELFLAPGSDRVFAFTTPPATQMAAPPNGATVRGSQWLDASASNAIGVNRVEFHLTGGALNNLLIGTPTSTTYGWLYRWDSTTVANGAYFLQSVAYDTTGISATSAAIGIMVKN